MVLNENTTNTHNMKMTKLSEFSNLYENKVNAQSDQCCTDRPNHNLMKVNSPLHGDNLI